MKWLKIIGGIILVVGIIGGMVGYKFYNDIFAPNVQNPDAYIFIPTGSTFENVLTILSNGGGLKNKASFEWVARQKNYPNHVHAGKYRLRNGMSNNDLVNLLRSASQTPVKVNFVGVHTKEDLAGKVGQQLEADSADIIQLLKNDRFLEEHGFTYMTVKSMFLQNTYEFYWNTSAEKFFKKMHREYEKFWTEDRKRKAEKLGYSQFEVITLASIVQAEQSKYENEKPTIAGLYLNRLRIGMPLQSDPTLIYAMGDFSIRRLRDRSVESPYNTYKYKGLPPGPINLPELSSIKAVLNHEEHNYIYMCAKEDFSGQHYFTSNYNQHMIYAKRYQNALKQRGIN